MSVSLQNRESAILLAVALWIAAFSLSCGLYISDLSERAFHAAGQDSLVGALFTEARHALSGTFYRTADTYFHKGAEYTEQRKLAWHPFEKLNLKVSPASHVHAGGREVKEIMPWLHLATVADPHNVEAFLVAAFWLRTEAGRPDLALRILKEARWKNPMNPRIELARARALLAQKELSKARSALEAGIAFLEEWKKKDPSEYKYVAGRLLSYSALLHQISGEKEKAIAELERVLSLFPERKGLRKRIDELKSGRKTRTRAYKLLNILLAQDAQATPRMMFHEATEKDTPGGRNHGNEHAHHDKSANETH
jgi:tetratricopeptide (TPR) repeat protein